MFRLFCLPHAGGGAQTFRAWPDALPDSVEICALQPPGRENRMKEPALSTVPSMLDAMVPALRPYLDKPFALFGHSMGAIIAFELARRLRSEMGLLPECLIISARIAPAKPLRRAPVCRLPQAEFIEVLRELNGTLPAVLADFELMQLMMDLLRADFTVHEEYSYIEGPALECPILAFGGTSDREAVREDIDAWREYTTKSFKTRMIPGDHFFVVSAQTLFLRLLSQDLYEIGKRVPSRMVSEAQ